MCFRVHSVRRIQLPHLAPSPSSSTPSRILTRHSQAQPRFAPNFPHSSRPHPTRTYSCAHPRAPVPEIKKSGSGSVAAVIVFGLVVSGALLYPLVGKSSEKKKREFDLERELAPVFDPSYTTDSYLVMAPGTPAGRPGTLTPEQEVKLRELWAVTMKVFGVYEAGLTIPEPNGSEAPSIAASTETTEKGKDGKKEKDKKKSRLHVFRRNKGDKEGETESTPASGTATPSDISALSIADEDDKHGQTKEFKAALANLAPEELRKAFWTMVKHDHPDGLLLRFLRARKWDVEKALVMMISTMHWRLEEVHVEDDIIRQGELAALEQSQGSDAKVKKEGEDFLTQLRLGKSFLHGLDKEGRPMCFVRVRLHKQGEQSEESLERFTVYTIETARMLLRAPIDTSTIVFDMSQFSMANMDYAPVKFMIKCFEANYPECLGTVLVYRAPWLFNTIWAIIRGWLDPVVAGKVHFCKSVDELEAFVPRSQIPVECGGDEKWEYVYKEPVPGENEKMKDTATRDRILEERKGLVEKYEGTVLEWIRAGEAQGSGIEERRKERDGVAEALRENYWRLDPYVRARSFYDRVGILGEGGKLDFYGEGKAATATGTTTTTTTTKTEAPKQETSPDDLD
ncbi:hypothetical protein B0J11DRAFT_4621 [Dendryphion nanum]|uniref:CRAL-TRIO domain-containing protein n=1 Tax=Dendryphion nanum TaxID=256645 RepID=A0A9P9IY62_9PLEO|nr:hypothetical protein B0J11DRAFT_4621 [Dendryphion nanum]